MAKVTGRVFITVAGRRLASKPGATLRFGGITREMVVADGGVVGYKEKLEAPGIDCSLIHTVDTSLADLQSITDGAGSFDTDSGKSYVLSGMVTLDGLEISDGETKLKFGALECKEV